MSIFKWLTGGLSGGDSQVAARLDAEMIELYQAVRPEVESGSVRSLAVTSAEPHEGRSCVAQLLAELLAEHRTTRVLLVDADGLRPSLRDAYHAAGEHDLAAVLAGRCSLAEAVQPTLLGNLELLAGAPGKLPFGDVASRQAVDRLLSEAHRTYEMVVFDTGPLLEAEEALVFCHSVDAVLLVVLAGVTQGEIASRAQRLLQRAKAKLLGVVVNDPRGEFVRDDR